MLTMTNQFKEVIVAEENKGYRVSDEVIYVTRDYDMFTIPPEQRPLTKQAIEEFLKILRENNDLAHHPIVVNPKMEITSGQTRHACARILKVDLYFMINKDAKITDSLMDGTATRPWTYPDVLHYWVALRSPEYLKLQEFLNRYDFFTPAGAAEMCTKGGGTSAQRKDKFYKGRYEFNDLAFGEKVARMALDFGKYFFFYREKPFVSVVKSLASDRYYDHRRMMNKVGYQSAKLTKQATSEAYFAILNVIYNNHLEKQNHVFLKSGNRKQK